MILPTKRRSSARSLVGIGTLVLPHLNEPKTISNLWWTVQKSKVTELSYPNLNFDQFVLSLDFLFLMEIINLKDGKIVRVEK